MSKAGNTEPVSLARIQGQPPGGWRSTGATGLYVVQVSVKRNTSKPEPPARCLFDIVYPGQANQDIEILHAFRLTGAGNFIFFDLAF